LRDVGFWEKKQYGYFIEIAIQISTIVYTGVDPIACLFVMYVIILTFLIQN